MRLFRRANRGPLGLMCIVSIAGLAGIGSAKATSLTVGSYTYTNSTPAGEPGFADAGGQLTDGVTGTPNVNDGTWVAWQRLDGGAAQITFNFPTSVTITDVSIDFLRNDNANTQLPENVMIGATVFPTTDFPTDLQTGFVDYAGSWTGSQVVVTLEHSQEHWVFVSEVQFNGSVDVTGSAPEPGTSGLAFAGILATLAWSRKRS